MGGKTSAESINKYKAKAYDRIEILVKKGQKQIIADYAKVHGESTNAFINRVIREAIERDKEKAEE